MGLNKLAIACAVGAGALMAMNIAFACPETTRGESPEDCPWAGVARTLIAEADAGRTLTKTFGKQLPDLAAQIRRDSWMGKLKSAWGTSLNYDEFAGGVIVHPEILQVIGKLARETIILDEGNSSAQHRVHAGFEHTYGYLFSVLATPFGYKRARWVRGEIEEGFGLPRGMLSPKPPAGTLFSNVTYFAGRIAFRGEAKALLALASRKIPRVLKDFAFSEIKPRRLVEKAQLLGGRTVSLRTDIIPFTSARLEKGNTALLIYSVLDSKDTGPRLITLFPVADDFVAKLFDPESLGNDKLLSIRYNGFIEGLSGATITGERIIEDNPTRGN